MRWDRGVQSQLPNKYSIEKLKTQVITQVNQLYQINPDQSRSIQMDYLLLYLSITNFFTSSEILEILEIFIRNTWKFFWLRNFFGNFQYLTEGHPLGPCLHQIVKISNQKKISYPKKFPMYIISKFCGFSLVQPIHLRISVMGWRAFFFLERRTPSPFLNFHCMQNNAASLLDYKIG